jgi:hypothetical protein
VVYWGGRKRLAVVGLHPDALQFLVFLMGSLYFAVLEDSYKGDRADSAIGPF